MPVCIGMAAQPRRFENLQKSLPILAEQCDKLWLIVNPDSTKKIEEPTPILPSCLDKIQNTEVIINSENLGDKEKFLGMQYQSSGYYLTVDDDILYPKDYVERMIEYMLQKENWCITCVHGSTFDPFGNLDRFIGQRKMYHFEWGYDRLDRVMIPGTGTACYEVTKFKMLPEEMPVTNMGDIWIACKAARLGVPIYTVPRPAGWLKGLPSFGQNIAENRPSKEMVEAVKRNKEHLQKMFRRLDCE